MATGALGGGDMIGSFLALAVLAVVFAVVWVMWWLLTDLLSVSSYPAARIRIAGATTRPSGNERQKEPRAVA